MDLDQLLDQFIYRSNNAAFVYDSVSYSYGWLKNEIEKYFKIFDGKITSGDVVQLCSDYNPQAIAIFIMLAYKKAIITPLTNIPEVKLDEYSDIMQPQMRISVSESGEITWNQLQFNNNHQIINKLRIRKHPGLIIMSSGTSGNSKAIVHDLNNILDAQKPTRSHKTILSFLMFDHIGGINTMLNVIISGNTLILPKTKDVHSVAQIVQDHSIQVLITSPSFLNLMTINDVWGKFNLSSLRHINYGSEVMSQHLLKTLSEMAPQAKLVQSYGTSETGVLKTTSESNQSLSIKISDVNTQFRIADGKLEIKSNTTMLGYLNAPSPFTTDGWFKTGDMVEITGEWMKILGRESDIINIGGKKVYPTEIENVILQIPQVKDVAVYSESHAILGNIVKANVFMNADSKSILTNIEKIKLIRNYCFGQLESYKIPQKFEFIDQMSYCRRYKKLRNNNFKGV